MSHQVNPPPVTVLQVTDSHLGERPGSALLGLDTDDSFIQTRALIAKQHGQADWLLATGDISNDGSIESYQRYRQLSAPLAQQVRWLPGNHDDVLAMVEATADGQEMDKLVELDHWLVVMLNSAVPGKVGGAFSEQELRFLADSLERNESLQRDDKSLEQSQSKHVLVCMHHHPIKSGCAWLDQQQISNADAFFEILDRFQTVRAVIWGHIHQEIDTWRNDVRLLAAPSSCIQFAANSVDFKLDQQAPGYRWLELYADGRIETEVSRLPAEAIASVDFHSAEGY